MSLINYAEARVLNYLFNNNGVNAATFASPPANWVALYTATPTDTGGGTEATGGAYARVRVYPSTSGSTPKWTAAADTTTPSGSQVVKNANTITFPQATASWGSIKAVGIKDASTSGNFLWAGVLTATKTVGQGDTFKFSTSNLRGTIG